MVAFDSDLRNEQGVHFALSGQQVGLRRIVNIIEAKTRCDHGIAEQCDRCLLLADLDQLHERTVSVLKEHWKKPDGCGHAECAGRISCRHLA